MSRSSTSESLYLSDVNRNTRWNWYSEEKWWKDKELMKQGISNYMTESTEIVKVEEIEIDDDLL